MALDLPLTLAVITIVAVLAFDFTNGFHDASNMTATVVGCHAMTPLRAILVATLFSFIGPVLGGTAVADTLGRIVILRDLPVIVAMAIIFAGMAGAIFWNLLTWWFGLPSSSSHALVGGVVGAALVASDARHVVWGGHELLVQGQLIGFTKVLVSLVLSPVMGFVAAYGLHRLVMRLLAGATPEVNRPLKKFQWVTMAGLAFAHGTNDAQKSMGIIAIILLIQGSQDHFTVPFWVMLTCALMITLGTLFGGWRIARTLAFGIFKLRPVHGFDSQISSCLVILAASWFGAPVSTTHVVGTTIMGIGAAEYPKKVKWTMALEILFTWIITIPCAGVVAALTYLALAWGLGLVT